MLMLNKTTAGNVRTAAPWGVCIAQWLLVAGVMLAFAIQATQAGAAQLDRIDVKRYEKLRETERYQLDIAEKYYRDQNWKVALAEYNKYLTLYEQSEGAPYAQLKWSICQINLRQHNTAIKEGFQSVIDYWPDSADAIIASYFIGKTYKDMGEIKKAKKAYFKVLEDNPQHLVAAYAMVDLIDISTIEEDVKGRVALWKKLTFETERTPQEVKDICVGASRDLANYYFWTGAFDEGVKALASTYDEKTVPWAVWDRGAGALQGLTGDEKTREKGLRLADLAIKYILDHMPTDYTMVEEKARARQYWFYVADIHNYARRYEEVPKVYNQMIQKFGVDDGILERMAAWYKGQKRYDEARATYAKYENKIEGLNQIAYSYREEQKVDLAAETYRRLSLQDAEQAVKWTGTLAQLYRDFGRYQEAIDTFTELIQIDGDHQSNWRYRIGEAYHNWGKYPEAIANYRQCDDIQNAYWQMASCHRALKQYSEAIGLYNQLRGAYPNGAPQYMMQVGYTLEEAGQAENAIKTFQSICKNFPNDGHASQAHARLQDKYKITVTLGGGTEDK